jgi:hypothetical protein
LCVVCSRFFAVAWGFHCYSDLVPSRTISLLRASLRPFIPLFYSFFFQSSLYSPPPNETSGIHGPQWNRHCPRFNRVKRMFCCCDVKKNTLFRRSSLSNQGHIVYKLSNGASDNWVTSKHVLSATCDPPMSCPALNSYNDAAWDFAANTITHSVKHLSCILGAPHRYSAPLCLPTHLPARRGRQWLGFRAQWAGMFQMLS